MSSNRPFIAARVEQWIDKRAESVFRLFGWKDRAIPYTGYGSMRDARVLGRVVLAPSWSDSSLGKAAEAFLSRRGWRNFITAATVHAHYTITCGATTVQGFTDRGGYIDHRIRGHQLQPGWQQAIIRLGEAQEFTAPLLIVSDDETLGIMSDVDDTVISTMLPRPLIAAWNSFFRTESTRLAVPGMARMYQELRRNHPDAPVIYVSTGAWNTQGFLQRFLERHRFPRGPVLLTDWGPTNTGWFRSGQMHKRTTLLQLLVDFPRIRWVLVGDDGQHDPEIYDDFAEHNPDHVRTILIRQLNPTEQFLAHGTLEPIEPKRRYTGHDVPVLRAPDGRGLISLIRARPDVTH